MCFWFQDLLPNPLRPIIGALLEKKCFFPLEMSNTCTNFPNPKIAEKWLSIGTYIYFVVCFPFSAAKHVLLFFRWSVISDRRFQILVDIARYRASDPYFSLFLRTFSFIFWKVDEDKCNIWYLIYNTQHNQTELLMFVREVKWSEFREGDLKFNSDRLIKEHQSI